jgi:hypothetical protein
METEREELRAVECECQRLYRPREQSNSQFDLRRRGTHSMPHSRVRILGVITADLFLEMMATTSTNGASDRVEIVRRYSSKLPR